MLLSLHGSLHERTLVRIHDLRSEAGRARGSEGTPRVQAFDHDPQAVRAARLEALRVRLCVPPPQAAEHVDHAVHSEVSQSTLESAHIPHG